MGELEPIDFYILHTVLGNMKFHGVGSSKWLTPQKKQYILSTNVAAKSRNLYTLFPFAWFCFDASALRLLDSKRYPEFSLETGWMPGRTQLLDWNGDGKTDRCGGVGFSEASSMTTFRRSERLGWRLPCTSVCDKIPLPLFLHEIAFLLKQLTISDSNSCRVAYCTWLLSSEILPKGWFKTCFSVHK